MQSLGRESLDTLSGKERSVYRLSTSLNHRCLVGLHGLVTIFFYIKREKEPDFEIPYAYIILIHSLNNNA